MPPESVSAWICCYSLPALSGSRSSPSPSPLATGTFGKYSKNPGPERIKEVVLSLMRLSQHSSPVPSASNHYFYIPVTPTSFRCQDHHQKPLNSSSPLKYASASPMTYRPGAEFTCKKSHLYLVELCVLQDTQSIQEHFMLIRLPRCCTYLCSTLLCGCTSLALHLISVHHTAQPYQFYGPSSLYC